jgi:hypothetical protein
MIDFFLKKNPNLTHPCTTGKLSTSLDNYNGIIFHGTKTEKVTPRTDEHKTLYSLVT